MMWIIVLIIVAAGACVMLVSVFMWWATERNAIWAIAAGVSLGLIAVAGAVFIAWLMTRHYWGPLDLIHAR
jgi:hypothetical protein